MADLAPGIGTPKIAAPLPTARQQLAAIAWMRWRLYVNGYRRINDRAIAARIFGYIGITVLLCIFSIGPLFFAGFTAYTSIARDQPHTLYYLLWTIFSAWQFFAINGSALAAAGQGFDDTAYIRFPLTPNRFVVLKFISSLIGAGFFFACVLFLAVAIGIGLADNSLFPIALCSLALFLAFNALVSRSLQTWINRWLSTRRAREAFTILSGLFFVGIQLVRLKFIQQHALAGIQHAAGAFSFLFTGPVHTLLAALPPSLAAEAILRPGISAHLLYLAAQFPFLALALATYVYRVRRQFLGEYLTDAPLAPKPKKSSPAAIAKPIRATGSISPIAACLQKEWAVQRRNTAQLMQMLMPLVFVVVFSANGHILANHPGYALPAAIGYSLMNILGVAYNLFGAEAAGVQFYLIAPVRIRDVVAAKHVIIVFIALIQTALASALAIAMAHTTLPAPAIFATLFWTAFLILVNLSTGAFRSVYAPVRIDAGKVTLSRRNASGSRSGAWLTMGVSFGSILVIYPVFALSHYIHQPWLPTPIFALLAAAAAVLYTWTLSRIDTTFYNKRETLVEILTKAGA